MKKVQVKIDNKNFIRRIRRLLKRNSMDNMMVTQYVRGGFKDRRLENREEV